MKWKVDFNLWKKFNFSFYILIFLSYEWLWKSLSKHKFLREIHPNRTLVEFYFVHDFPFCYQLENTLRRLVILWRHIGQLVNLDPQSLQVCIPKIVKYHKINYPTTEQKGTMNLMRLTMWPHPNAKSFLLVRQIAQAYKISLDKNTRNSVIMQLQTR